MSKQKSNYELNRKEYNKVRKMDHNQMQTWANDIFLKGKNSNNTISPEQLYETVLSVKGIGESKAIAIMEALSPFMIGN